MGTVSALPGSWIGNPSSVQWIRNSISADFDTMSFSTGEGLLLAAPRVEDPVEFEFFDHAEGGPDMAVGK